MTSRTLRLSVLAFLLLSAGCLTPTTLYKSVAVGAALVSGGYRVLAQVDAEKQAAIRDEAKLDKAKAAADLASWLVTYDKVRKALDVLCDAVEGAYKAAPSLDQAGIGKWIGILAVATVTATHALTDAGIKLPGGL